VASAGWQLIAWAIVFLGLDLLAIWYPQHWSQRGWRKQNYQLLDRSTPWVAHRVIPAPNGTRRAGVLCLFWRLNGSSADYCVDGCDVWTRSRKVLTSGQQVRCWHSEYWRWWSSGCAACPRIILRRSTWLWRSKQTCMTSLRRFSASDSVQRIPVWRHLRSGNPFTHLNCKLSLVYAVTAL